MSSHNRSGNKCESADVEVEEASEEEEEFEEEESEVEANEEEQYEDPDGEEEPCEGNSNEEEEPSEDNPTEEEQCEEVVSEQESSEKPDEDPSEEESSEVAQQSSVSDGGEVHQLYSITSSSGNKRADSLEGNVQKRQKQDPNLKITLCDRLSGSDIQCMPKNLTRDGIVSQNQESIGRSSKKRRSRWDKERHSRWDTVPGSDGKADNGVDVASKKRKTRWASADTQLEVQGPLKLPDLLKAREIQNLNVQFLEINQKLRAREICDDRPENERSPSPPPIYNYLGIKINTREVRIREKLIKQRSKLISDLIRRDPTFKPPFDYKLPKFSKKLYVPVNEYPGYNFIGLILGPSGLTQKRMEKESGAYIKLRGKNSVKESKNHTYNDTENEDLHVYIEAHTQESLDAAVAMVEKLLVPVKEEKNEFKHAQLRELEMLRRLSKDFYAYSACEICGAASHLTTACPLTASTPGTGISDHQIDSRNRPGNGLFASFTGPQAHSSTMPRMANPTSAALSSYTMNPVKEIDEAKLFVGCLPLSVNEDKLIELFLPFGQVCEAWVIKDKGTGLSKGCGFIKYVDPILAAEAIVQMNGYMIEGKILSVQVADCHPSTAGTGTSDHQIDSLNKITNEFSAPISGPQGFSSTLPPMVNPASGALSSNNCKSIKEIDEANLFVGYLPQSVYEDKLIELFLPFGQIVEARVIKDKSTGLSKGCGFVKYVDCNSAADAIARMNGYRIEGKMLAVRVAGHPPSTLGTGTSDHQIDSLTKIGNEVSATFSRLQVSASTIPVTSNPASGASSSYHSKPVKEIDEGTLFVGYLPQSVNEDKLIELFLPFGQICEARVIKNKSTGLSKGCGFIKYVDAISATEAIARMNGYRIEGKMLAVRVAGRLASMAGIGTSDHRIDSLNNVGNELSASFTGPQVSSSTMPPTANGESGASSSHYSKPVKDIDEAKLFVGYLPQSVNEDKLIELFLPFGQICEARVIKDKSTGLSKGCGFIKYVNSISATEAIARMNGYRIEGKMLAVRVAGRLPSMSGTGTSDHQIDSVIKIGNELSATFSGPQVPISTIPLTANPASGALSSENSWPVKEIDEAKLFVGYIPQSVNEDRLIELFLPFGQLYEAIIVKDKRTGLSKGYGFVKYVDAIFAAEAVARMNGYKIEGKVLAVRVAGRTPSMPGIGTSDHQIDSLANLSSKSSATFTGPLVPISTILPASGALSSENSRPVKEIDAATIYVGYLPQSVNEDKLIGLFLPFGQICEAKVVKDRSTGLSKGYGFIKYVDAIFAAEAVARMNGYRIEGKTLAVRVKGCSLSTVDISPVPGVPQSSTLLPPNSGPAAIAEEKPCLVPMAITQGNSVPGVPRHFSHLPTYHPGPAAINQGNPALIPATMTQGNPVLGVPQSFTHLPSYPGPVAIAQGNPSLVLAANTQGNFMPEIPQSFTHLPTYPGRAAVAQGNLGLVPLAFTQGHPGPMGWPGPPGSVLPDSYGFFPKSSGIVLQTDPVSRQSPTSFSSSSQTTALASLTPGGITSSSTSYSLFWQPSGICHLSNTSTMSVHSHSFQVLHLMSMSCILCGTLLSFVICQTVKSSRDLLRCFDIKGSQAGFRCHFGIIGSGDH